MTKVHLDSISIRDPVADLLRKGKPVVAVSGGSKDGKSTYVVQSGGEEIEVAPVFTDGTIRIFYE